MPRLVQLSNNSASTLASAITDTATSITVASGQGSKFPTLSAGQYFMATLIGLASGNIEIVKVTARSGDTLTVVRAQEAIAGTAATAYAFATGDKLEARLTAGVLANELDRIEEAANINVLTKTAAYTILAADNHDLIRVSTASASVTITLPDISTLTDDFSVMVAKISTDANSVTLARSGSDTINGGTSYLLGLGYQTAWLVADRATNTWTVLDSAQAVQSMKVDTFTGAGTTPTLTLSGTPNAKNNTAVFVGGVYQAKSTYTLTGNQITLGGSVASGVPIEVLWSQSLAMTSIQTSLDSLQAQISAIPDPVAMALVFGG